MVVELSPQQEALIRPRIESGAFSNAEEVIARALDYLNAEEDWLLANKTLIQEQIQEGWDEAERGELMDAEDVKAEMERFTTEWSRRNTPA